MPTLTHEYPKNIFLFELTALAGSLALSYFVGAIAGGKLASELFLDADSAYGEDYVVAEADLAVFGLSMIMGALLGRIKSLTRPFERAQSSVTGLFLREYNNDYQAAEEGPQSVVVPAGCARSLKTIVSATAALVIALLLAAAFEVFAMIEVMKLIDSGAIRSPL